MSRSASAPTSVTQYTLFGREGAVYPGHPLVLAYLVMRNFESLEDANAIPRGKVGKNVFSRAALPGSIANLETALAVLALTRRGELTLARDIADQAWLDSRHQTLNREAWEEGLAQAETVAMAYLQEAPGWCALPLESAVAA